MTDTDPPACHNTAQAVGQSTCRKIPILSKTYLTVYIGAALPLPVGDVVFTSFMQMLHPTDGYRALLPVAVNTVDITSIEFTQCEEKNRYHNLCLGVSSAPP